MNRLMYVVVFLVASGLLSYQGSTSGQALAAGTIVAFGDSITAGYPYQKMGNGCYYCGGYEYTLQDFLSWEGKGRYVLNYGVSGELTYEGVNRFDSVMAAAYPVDYVLIMEGTNDLTFYLDPGTVAYNIYWMAYRALQWGAVPLQRHLNT